MWTGQCAKRPECFSVAPPSSHHQHHHLTTEHCHLLGVTWCVCLSVSLRISFYICLLYIRFLFFFFYMLCIWWSMLYAQNMFLHKTFAYMMRTLLLCIFHATAVIKAGDYCSFKKKKELYYIQSIIVLSKK